MSDATRADILASIVPKSDQLNADDLLAGPMTVTITGVKRGDSRQKIVVELEGLRPYKPCTTMRRILVAVFGDDPQAWIRERMTLFCDPEVMFSEHRVGGIRISHLSGLTEPRTFLITVGRGKRVEFTVYPLAQSANEKMEVARLTVEIAKASTADELAAIGQTIKSKPEATQAALRPVYSQRKRELENGASGAKP